MMVHLKFKALRELGSTAGNNRDGFELANRLGKSSAKMAMGKIRMGSRDI